MVKITDTRTTAQRVNDRDFQNKLKKFTDVTLPKMQQDFLEKLALRAVYESSLICPVRTGNLRSTIRSEVPEGVDPTERIDVVAGGIQGSGRTPSLFVNYAKYVHDGTSRQAAQPFLQVGVERATKQLGDIVKSVRSD